MTTCIIIPWFNYWRTKNTEEFGPLKDELEKEGHKVYLFDYEERPQDTEDLLKRLNNLIKKTKAKKVTLIGFSLGSYLSVKYVEKYGQKNASTRKTKKSEDHKNPSGSTHEVSRLILCIPLINGSKSFKTIYKIKPNWIKESGKVLHQATYEKLDPKSIPKEITVGVISGTKRMGWNRFISYLSQAVHKNNKNDGLFSTEEGKFGEHQRLILKVNHYTAPRNKSLIKAVKHFIKDSTFKPNKDHAPDQK